MNILDNESDSVERTKVWPKFNWGEYGEAWESGMMEADLVGRAPSGDSPYMGCMWFTEISAILIDVGSGLASSRVGKGAVGSGIIGKTAKSAGSWCKIIYKWYYGWLKLFNLGAHPQCKERGWDGTPLTRINMVLSVRKHEIHDTRDGRNPKKENFDKSFVANSIERLIVIQWDYVLTECSGPGLRWTDPRSTVWQPDRNPGWRPFSSRNGC